MYVSNSGDMKWVSWQIFSVPFLYKDSICLRVVSLCESTMACKNILNAVIIIDVCSFLTDAKSSEKQRSKQIQVFCFCSTLTG